jgi:hypothetical protein
MLELSHITPLFALDDWLNVVFFVVVAVIWILGQLFGREHEAPPAPKRRIPQAGGRRPGTSPADEIDRFLREVASRRQQTQQPPPEVEVLRPQPARRPGGAATVQAQPPRPQERRWEQPRHPADTARPRTPPPKPATPVAVSTVDSSSEVRAPEPLGRGPGELPHMPVASIDASATTMAAPDAQPLAAGLGDLSQAGLASRRAAGGPEQLANLLSSGVGLRQAIVLTEVFGPPRARRPIRR